MRLLVCGCTRSAAAVMAERPDRVGVLMTPRAGDRVGWAEERNAVWAADNDCFGGFDPGRWLRFLAKLTEAGSRPVFVTCPDVVADAGATWRLFDVWQPVLRSLGLPACLVLQDGQERMKWLYPLRASWDRIAAVFVGGSTSWKESAAALALCREARAAGKWVHVGRVNSLRRIELFAGVADSFDGTGFSAFGDKRIKLAVRWIDRALAAERHPRLFAGVGG